MDNENIIELRNISKVFPNGVVANQNISFAVRRGEIHSIVGENGAGKTTLMNLLFGLYQPSSGDILINGKKEVLSTPLKAIGLGIGMVHQHFMLVQNFTVLQNIILGSETGNALKLNYKEAEKKARELSERYGLRVDLNAKASDISVPVQQRVEILKVLWHDAEIIIFDEPTAVLTPQEIDEFCNIVLGLKKQGKTVLFISHKLAEVMRISDRITVIRRGEVVTTKDVNDTDENDLAYLMVGHQVKLGGGQRETMDASRNRCILQLDQVVYKQKNINKLDGVCLEVNQGEIVGVAGVDGNGQEELVNVICGKMHPTSGKVLFDGKDITDKNVKQIKEYGLATIYEDRQKDGLLMSSSLVDNSILGYQERYVKYRQFLNRKQIEEHAEKLREKFDIRTVSMEVYASTLSGGNQQKVIIAREISSAPKLLMAVQPTRGLDMGAIEYVHNKLIEQRNQGSGVLLFSLELDEILQVSDRVLVIFDGKIVANLENKNLTKRMLGEYMLGVVREEANT